MTDPRPHPRDWHEAFASLPLEAPPEGAMQRFAGQLRHAPARPRRRPAAIAAMVCLLAAGPALMLLRQPPKTTVAPPPATTAATRAPDLEQPPAPRAQATAAARGTGTPGAHATPTQAAPQGVASIQPRAAATVAPAGDIDRLHVESARLEALLAELSDGTGGDGVQLALASSLQAQVAGIDEALSQAGLDEPARTGLWRERVDALTQLTSLAADRRLAALYGSGVDYALLPVY